MWTTVAMIGRLVGYLWLPMCRALERIWKAISRVAVAAQGIVQSPRRLEAGDGDRRLNGYAGLADKFAGRRSRAPLATSTEQQQRLLWR